MFEVHGIGSLDLTLFIISIIAVLVWVRWRRPAKYPPGPVSLPLIGNLLSLFGDNLMETFSNLRKQYGDIYSLALGNYWVVFVYGSENIRELLVKQGEKTIGRPDSFQFQVLDHPGVITANGSSWKHNRTFLLTKLRDFGLGKRCFESSIKEEMAVFIQTVGRHDGTAFDMDQDLNISMSNIVMSISLGRRFDYDDPQFLTFCQDLEKNIKDPTLTGPVNFIPILAKLPGDFFGAKKVKQTLNETLKFFENEIHDHENTVDENNIRDFIDAYLVEMRRDKSEEPKFSGTCLLGIINDLFIAGTETTATTLKWALLYFMHNDDIQQKMWDEIDRVVGSGRYPSVADKPNLPYCEAVMFESLRLGNVLPFSVPHKATDDISYKGMVIPKDSIVMPCLYSVALDETLFPDSHTFRPERFLDANNKVCGQEKILTFSVGRRVCLGESFARLELFLYLTSLVQRFKFLPPEGEDPAPIKGILGATYSPVPYRIRAVHR